MNGAALRRGKGQLLLDELVPQRSPDPTQELILRAIVLSPNYTATVDGKLLDVTAGIWRGDELLLLTGTSGLRVLSASTGVVLLQTADEGLIGALVVGDDIVGFGPSGLVNCAAANDKARTIDDRPVSSAAVTSDGVIAVSDSTLTLWAWEPGGPSAMAKTKLTTPTRGLVAIADRVVAYGDQGLHLVTIEDGGLAVTPLLDVETSQLVARPGSGARALATIGGLQAVLDMAGPEAPRPVVVIDAEAPPPWSLASTALRDGIAIRLPDDETVDVLRVHNVVDVSCH